MLSKQLLVLLVQYKPTTYNIKKAKHYDAEVSQYL